MNKLTNMKALLLFAFFALFLLNPASLNAQKTDGFFRGGNDNYENRDAVNINDDGGINNYGIGETVPLGSGLLILTAAGAGYAISKRRRNKGFKAINAIKGLNAIMITMVLLLGMTQCKKKVETISKPVIIEGVHITLDVCDDDGSKVVVTPGYENPVTHEIYANVQYENGDKIYVGYNNAYVGELTYNGTAFSGSVNIAAPVGEQPLHFYLLGGKGFTPSFDGNTATVVISDQSTQYPVISYYHSNEPYTGTGTYTSKLRNKCSIMKFNVETPSTSPICIMGMNNMVTVDFTNPGGSDNGFSYSKYQDIGEIKMSAGAGTAENPAEKWAVVLPQSALDLGVHEAYTSIAEVMSLNEDYLTGSRCAIPEIGRNQYLSDATDRTITVNETPKFSVSSSQKVIFAPGNLQATTDDDWATWNWSFMEHQYSYSVDEGLNDEIWDDDYDTYRYTSDAHVTMFKWGANGLSGGEKPYTITAKDSKYKADLTSAQDWGVPANAANLGGHNNWRTPSMGEWSYVASRKILDNKDAYGFAVIDKMKGFILLPDNWNGAIDPGFVYGFVEGQTNIYTAESWESMEFAGVVFLPAAGYRAAVLMTEFWLVGTYWSTNYGGIQYDESNHVDRTCAYAFTFNYHGQGYDGDVYEYVDDGDFYTPGLTSANYDSYTIPSWTTTDWRTWIYPTHNPQPGSYTPDPRPAPDPDGWEEDNDFTYYASSVRLIRNVE